MTEQQVIELRREGKTIREIAKCLHKSSRKVEDVLKNNEQRELEEEIRARENQSKGRLQSNYTKGLKLLSKGASVLDVPSSSELLRMRARRRTLIFGIYRPLTNLEKTITSCMNIFLFCCPYARR